MTCGSVLVIAVPLMLASIVVGVPATTPVNVEEKLFGVLLYEMLSKVPVLVPPLALIVIVGPNPIKFPAASLGVTVTMMFEPEATELAETATTDVDIEGTPGVTVIEGFTP